MSKAQLQKIWKAVAAARQEPDQVGLLPTGDVLVVVDGGRQDESLLNHLGMGSSRRRHDASRSHKEGKVIYRAVTLFFEEKSVKARKYRRRTRHDVVNCTQRAHIFYSALTKVQERQQKHFSELSNLCNMLGPYVLPAWGSLPLMLVSQKKQFWAGRRRAVGGPSDTRKPGEKDSGDEDAMQGTSWQRTR